MLLALGCAPQAELDGHRPDRRPTPTQTAADCAQGKTLTDGMLTVGTDSPAYDAVVHRQRPDQRQGLRVRRGVRRRRAARLRPRTRSTWVKVPFNTSYAPGPKDFDFDINQISITPGAGRGRRLLRRLLHGLAGRDRAEGRAGARGDQPRRPQGPQARRPDRHHVADRDPRRRSSPTTDPLVFEDTNAAKQALLNGQVDAIVADLPTAFYITAVEIPKAHDRRAVPAGDRRARRSSGCSSRRATRSSTCVNQALAALRSDGTLDAIEQQWLSDVVDVPDLQ